MVQEKTKLYRGVRPDSFTDWSTKEWTKETGKSLAVKWIHEEYEKAVGEQKKEVKEFKRKAKAQAQLPQVEPVPLTIEEDLSQARDEGEGAKPIEA